MKKFKLIFFLLPLWGFSQSLSFNEAIEELNNNKKLMGMNKMADAAEIGAEAMTGLKFPELSLNGSIVYMNDDLSLNLNKYKYPVSALTKIPPEKLGNWDVPFQERNIGKLSLDFKWPILTGGKIKAGIEAEKLKAKIASVEAEQTRDVLFAELAERYFQADLAQNAIKVRNQALESAELHLHNATKLEENGFIAPVETMQAKTAKADAERELLAAEKDEELAKAALNGLLNRESENYELSTHLFYIGKLQPLTYYQELAVQNYPELVKAGLKKKLAEQNIKAEESNFVPDVALIGKKYLITENLPLTEPDWYVGVGMQVNLFNGFRNRKNYQKAIAISEGVDLLKKQAETDIKTLVKKYYTEILKQQEQVKSLDESIGFSEELVRVRTKAFKEGFATSTDVSDANLYLASIRIKKLKALMQMDIYLAKLLETCGITHEFNNYIL